MQQAYSILVQSESSYMKSPYCHYADIYISQAYIICLGLSVVLRCRFWAVRPNR